MSVEGMGRGKSPTTHGCTQFSLVHKSETQSHLAMHATLQGRLTCEKGNAQHITASGMQAQSPAPDMGFLFVFSLTGIVLCLSVLAYGMGASPKQLWEACRRQMEQSMAQRPEIRPAVQELLAQASDSGKSTPSPALKRWRNASKSPCTDEVEDSDIDDEDSDVDDFDIMNAGEGGQEADGTA